VTIVTVSASDTIMTIDDADADADAHQARDMAIQSHQA